MCLPFRLLPKLCTRVVSSYARFKDHTLILTNNILRRVGVTISLLYVTVLLPPYVQISLRTLFQNTNLHFPRRIRVTPKKASLVNSFSHEQGCWHADRQGGPRSTEIHHITIAVIETSRWITVWEYEPRKWVASTTCVRWTRGKMFIPGALLCLIIWQPAHASLRHTIQLPLRPELNQNFWPFKCGIKIMAHRTSSGLV
jgi:hypothetical protein